jgi:predicted MFS family arabinose efflux permease
MRVKEEMILVAYVFRAAGDWIFRFAVPLFLYERTHSAIGTALGYVLTFAPPVVFAIPAGVLADRFDKRSIIWILDAIGLLLCLGLAIELRGNPSLFTIYALIVTVSTVGTFYHVAFQASVPLAISEANLARANALVNATDSVFGALGPLVGAAVVTTLGYAAAVYINAASFFLAATTILTFTRFRSPKVVGVPASTMVRSGIRAIKDNTLLRFGVLLFLVNNFALFLYLSVFIYYIKHDVGMSDLAVGLVYSAGGVAAVLGSYSARWAENGPWMPMTRIAVAAIALGLLTLPIAYGSALAIVGGWICVNFLNALIVVTYFTERQRLVPTDVLGRVVSLTRMVAYAAIPIGAGVGALASRFFSVPQLIMASGLLVTAFGLTFLLASHKEMHMQSTNGALPGAADSHPSQ